MHMSPVRSLASAWRCLAAGVTLLFSFQMGAAHAQLTDGNVSFGPYIFSVTPTQQGSNASLEFGFDELFLVTNLCDPGALCIEDRQVRWGGYDSVSRHRSLNAHWSDGYFVSSGGGGHMQTHFEPSPLQPRGSLVDYWTHNQLQLSVSPHTTLSVGYHVTMALDPEVAPGLPYDASAWFDLGLHLRGGGVIGYRAELDASDGVPDMFDEGGVLTFTNDTASAVDVWLWTDAGIRTSIAAIPEPGQGLMLLAGLLVLAAAAAIRPHHLRTSAATAHPGAILRRGCAALALLTGATAVQAQTFDGHIDITSTRMQIDGGAWTPVDWKYVGLQSQISVPAAHADIEFLYRYDTPETFSHRNEVGASWVTQEYLGDIPGGSAAVHWESPGAMDSELRSAFVTRTWLALMPGETLNVSAHVFATLLPQPNGLDNHLMHATSNLSAVFGDYALTDGDGISVETTDGTPATLDDVLTISVYNNNSYGLNGYVDIWSSVWTTVTVVPEPSNCLMLAVGAALLVARVRGRRAAPPAMTAT